MSLKYQSCLCNICITCVGTAADKYLLNRKFFYLGQRFYIVRLVGATRNDAEIARGASPRATLAVAAMSKAVAQLRGRDYVIPGDVREVFARCVEHRLILTPRAQTQGILPGDVLERIVQSVPAPKLR